MDRRNETIPHLSRVQFVLAHDLDGDFLTRLAIDGLVDVGKGAIAHLLDQPVLFQTLACQYHGSISRKGETNLIDRHLFTLCTLISNDPFGLFAEIGRWLRNPVVVLSAVGGIATRKTLAWHLAVVVGLLLALPLLIPTRLLLLCLLLCLLLLLLRCVLLLALLLGRRVGLVGVFAVSEDLCILVNDTIPAKSMMYRHTLETRQHLVVCQTGVIEAFKCLSVDTVRCRYTSAGT